MKRANFVLILVLSFVGAFAQAANADCPLKNLKKNQLLSDMSTAYFPGRSGRPAAVPLNPGTDVFMGN